MNKNIYDLYMKEIENFPLMSKNEEYANFKEWKENGNKQAKNNIYNANLRFVVKVAHRYKNQGIFLTDLISEGNMALNTAIEQFDYTNGLKFITYAIWYIRQAMLELLANQSRFVSITGTEATQKYKLNKAKIKLNQKLQREPTIDEIEKETGFLISKIKHMDSMLDNNLTISLYAPIQKNTHIGRTIQDVIPNNTFESPENFENLTDLIKKYFEQAKLDDKSIHILNSYFGLDCEPQNLEEISFDYGHTRERMRQIKEAAIEKLKNLTNKVKNLK